MKVTDLHDLCGISVAMSDKHIGWLFKLLHHCIYICHLASNFNIRFHGRSLKVLFVRAMYARHPHKLHEEDGQHQLRRTTSYIARKGVLVLQWQAKTWADNH